MEDLAGCLLQTVTYAHGNPGGDRVAGGVSEATVSRVLNDKPGVSDGARQAVLTALDVLGYERPSRLRRRSAGLVGLVVPELENPIFPAFAQVIDDVLASRRYTPVLCTQSPGGISEDEYVESLLDHGVAGIVFVSGRHADARADHDRYRSLIQRGMPVVFVNGFAAGLDAPFLSTDDHEAMTLAVSHLVQLGHRNIGLAVGPAPLRPREAQARGASSPPSAATLGARPEEAEARGSRTGSSPSRAARPPPGRLLDRGVTPIVCGSDLMALGAIRAAREPGARRARRRLRDRVRRLPPDPVPRPAAHDRATAGPGDGRGRCGRAGRRDRGSADPLHEYLYKPELVLRSSTGPAPSRTAQPIWVPSAEPTAYVTRHREQRRRRRSGRPRGRAGRRRGGR